MLRIYSMKSVGGTFGFESGARLWKRSKRIIFIIRSYYTLGFETLTQQFHETGTGRPVSKLFNRHIIIS